MESESDAVLLKLQNTKFQIPTAESGKKCDPKSATATTTTRTVSSNIVHWLVPHLRFITAGLGKQQVWEEEA